MMTKKIIKIFFIVAFVAVLFVGVRASMAAEIVDVNFPCSSGSCQQPTDFPSYLNTIYKFAIGISGLLALGMIVAGGVYYTVSAGNSGRQTEARSMITSAIWGLVLLFGSYLILNTVNPQITKLGLNFTDTSGNAITPISPEPTSSVIGASDCQVFSSMATFPNNYQKLTTPDANCGYRKIITPSELSVGTPSQYYEETVTVPPNSTIWQYPYFIKSDGVSTAKCLIFAFREPTSSSTESVTLRDSLSMCPSQKQLTGVSTNPASASACSPNDPLPANTYSDQEARSEINDINNHSNNSVNIASSGGCSDRCNSSCTSLQGIPKRTVSTDLKYLSQYCVDDSGKSCSITITGGTEIGHQTHGLGKPVLDFSFDEGLAKYLNNSYRANIDAICTAPQDSQYRINCGNYDETVRHLHVQFKL